MAADTLPKIDPALARQLAAAYAQATAERRNRTLLGLVLLVVAIVAAGFVAEVRPGTLFAHIDRLTKYLGDIMPVLRWESLGADLAEWLWGWKHWLKLLGETLLIAYVGTLLSAVGAFLLCFAAAGNLVRSAWARIAARRFLEFCRTVPEIVFALIFVIAFGLGAVPGVLAIMIHTVGALGKLFAEVVENIDMKPVEGIVSTGATFPEVVRFAVVPQVLSNFVSYALLRFEINVRGAAVMGFVGAGGIGQDLIEAIRKFYYSDVSAILLCIVLCVMVIDFLTERLRHALLSAEVSR